MKTYTQVKSRIAHLKSLFNRSLDMYRVTGDYKYKDMCFRIMEWQISYYNYKFEA